MRKEVDKTGYKLCDLADQPRGDYLLVWVNKLNQTSWCWVDTFEASQTGSMAIKFLRRIPETVSEETQLYETVVVLSTLMEWSLTEAALVEVATFEEYMQQERIDMVERVRISRLMNQAEEYAKNQPVFPFAEQSKENEGKMDEVEFERWYREEQRKKREGEQ